MIDRVDWTEAEPVAVAAQRLARQDRHARHRGCAPPSPATDPRHRTRRPAPLRFAVTPSGHTAVRGSQSPRPRARTAGSPIAPEVPRVPVPCVHCTQRRRPLAADRRVHPPRRRLRRPAPSPASSPSTSRSGRQTLEPRVLGPAAGRRSPDGAARRVPGARRWDALGPRHQRAPAHRWTTREPPHPGRCPPCSSTAAARWPACSAPMTAPLRTIARAAGRARARRARPGARPRHTAARTRPVAGLVDLTWLDRLAGEPAAPAGTGPVLAVAGGPPPAAGHRPGAGARRTWRSGSPPTRRAHSWASVRCSTTATRAAGRHARPARRLGARRRRLVRRRLAVAVAAAGPAAGGGAAARPAGRAAAARWATRCSPRWATVAEAWTEHGVRPCG